MVKLQMLSEGEVNVCLTHATLFRHQFHKHIESTYFSRAGAMFMPLGSQWVFSNAMTVTAATMVKLKTVKQSGLNKLYIGVFI